MILPFLKQHYKVLSVVAGENSALAPLTNPMLQHAPQQQHNSSEKWEKENYSSHATTPLTKCQANWS